MKRLLTGSVLGALLAVGTAQMQGQTFETNVFQLINVNLTGYAQGDGGTLVPVHITTPQVIRALGTALGANFSSRAVLMVFTPAGSTQSSIVVRDIVARVPSNTDVSSYFDERTIAAVSRVNAAGKGTQYSIEEFILRNVTGGPTFDVQGWTTTVLGNSSLVANVAGTGTDTSGRAAVLHGTITVGAERTERLRLP